MPPVPLLAVLIATAPVKLVGELKSTASLVVVTSPAVWMLVAPVRVTAPSALISPAAAMFKVPPVALRVTIPLLAVVIGALTVMFAFFTFTPAIPVVLIAPPKVVLPVPVV